MRTTKTEATNSRPLLEDFNNTLKPFKMKNTKTTNINPLVQARQNSLDTFSQINHRLEDVRTWNGIDFVNDSKSTDIESTLLSLESVKKPIVWIVGSTELERDFSSIEKLVRLKVKSIISFGEYRGVVQKSLAELTDSYAHHESLEECFDTILSRSKSGDAVVFSPACSSYENYESFRDRGNHFTSLVNEL